MVCPRVCFSLLCALSVAVGLTGCASSRGLRTALDRYDSREVQHFSAQDDDAISDDVREALAATPTTPRPRDDRDQLSLVKSQAADSIDENLEILLTGYRAKARRKTADGEEAVEMPSPVQRFQVPPELPGSEAEPLRVPPVDPQQSFEDRKELMTQLYGSVPPLPAFAEEDASQPSWTLEELEQVAWENHPALAQAAAQMEVARGEMIQAGLHPNPSVGWEEDTIANGIQGYRGPFWNQTIVTGGKLKLARCAAAMGFEIAQVEYQRTKIDIATRVRSAYYELVVAQQRRRMLWALARLTDEIYSAQVELVAGGQAAAYEPLQVRVFAVQARNAVIEAHNAVIAAGRKLGAATGMIEVETFHTADAPVTIPSRIDFHAAKAFLLENHTDLRIARNRVVQSQFASRLEYIRPRIPDLTYYQTVQHAYEVGPYVNSYNMQISAPIPIFDRNQGNILATQSSIISHERSYAASQNYLTGQLADVIARFETARAKAENYRNQMLPDQVRTYRGIYSRYREAGPGVNDNINFGDVIVAQQTLGTAVNDYAGVLMDLWSAYVAAAELLQTEDLRTLDAWFGVGN